MPVSPWDFDLDNDARDVWNRMTEDGRSVRNQGCTIRVVHSVFYCGDMVCDQPKF